MFAAVRSQRTVPAFSAIRFGSTVSRSPVLMATSPGLEERCRPCTFRGVDVSRGSCRVSGPHEGPEPIDRESEILGRRRIGQPDEAIGPGESEILSRREGDVRLA